MRPLRTSPVESQPACWTGEQVEAQAGAEGQDDPAGSAQSGSGEGHPVLRSESLSCPAPELLEQIRQVRIERDNAVAELAMLIDAAVSQDLGWPQIASQLGVTRQAARQQYQRRHPGGASHWAYVS